MFETKDSGEREEYASGMRRDTQTGKPRFDLLLVDGIPFESQFLTRFAGLLQRGAEKYGERNWQLADSAEELARFKASALRHMMQWACGETDEDHATAVAFNLMAYEATLHKIRQYEGYEALAKAKDEEDKAYELAMRLRARTAQEKWARDFVTSVNETTWDEMMEEDDEPEILSQDGGGCTEPCVHCGNACRGDHQGIDLHFCGCRWPGFGYYE